jgi:hypothetical protein
MNVITNIFDTLETSKLKNMLFELPEGTIYVRFTTRKTQHGTFISNIGEKILEIINVNFNEDFRGQGAFMRYLKLFEEEGRARNYVAIVVERIPTERFYNFFKKQDYKDSYELSVGIHMESSIKNYIKKSHMKERNVYKMLSE